MITHRIITFTPPEPVYQPGVYRGNEMTFPSRNVNLSGITHQRDYDTYLETKPPVGSIICMNTAEQPVVNTYQLNYVLDVQNSFDRLTFTPFGKIESHLICQVREVYTEDGIPYIRWTDMTNWRLITSEEYERFVNDNVQNYLDKVVSARKKALQKREDQNN